ncbi:DUF2508 family protein [Paenibacillus tarimensis]
MGRNWLTWLNWWKRWSNPNEQEKEERNELPEGLIKEIHDAHRDWVNAQRHFEYALGKDQVDYAIFAIEAAEKRYEMLLRHAKSLPVAWPMQTERL